MQKMISVVITTADAVLWLFASRHIMAVDVCARRATLVMDLPVQVRILHPIAGINVGKEVSVAVNTDYMTPGYVAHLRFHGLELTVGLHPSHHLHRDISRTTWSNSPVFMHVSYDHGSVLL